MPYKPIESYGVLGDLHTVALVSMDGSIDWCCLPQFDSPSIFAAILDERKGGFFKIASLYEVQHKQMYLPDSNVLLTRAAARRRTSRSCRAARARSRASGSNANLLATTRGGRIGSLWKAPISRESNWKMELCKGGKRAASQRASSSKPVTGFVWRFSHITFAVARL